MPSDYIEEMSKYMTCKLTPFSLVKLSQGYRDIMKEWSQSDKYTGDFSRQGEPGFYKEFLDQPNFIYLGEIPNMPGHVVVAGNNGRIYYGFHDDDFEELTEDEV